MASVTFAGLLYLCDNVIPLPTFTAQFCVVLCWCRVETIVVGLTFVL